MPHGASERQVVQALYSWVMVFQPHGVDRMFGAPSALIHPAWLCLVAAPFSALLPESLVPGQGLDFRPCVCKQVGPCTELLLGRAVFPFGSGCEEEL